ncbi:MAG: hypothetical protein QM767_01365 [Anaeromyxobacter sp.]
MRESGSWSISTSSPTVKPGLEASVTEVAPLTPFEARLVAVPNLSEVHRLPSTTTAWFEPAGFTSRAVGRPFASTAPRSTTLDLPRTTPLPVMVYVPALSFTTCPAGQAWMAALMAAVSSPPLGDSVAQRVERAGIPPWLISPGFQMVRRSASMMPDRSVLEGVTTRAVALACSDASTMLVATMLKLPVVAGAT